MSTSYFVEIDWKYWTKTACTMNGQDIASYSLQAPIFSLTLVQENLESIRDVWVAWDEAECFPSFLSHVEWYLKFPILTNVSFYS